MDLIFDCCFFLPSCISRIRCKCLVIKHLQYAICGDLSGYMLLFGAIFGIGMFYYGLNWAASNGVELRKFALERVLVFTYSIQFAKDNKSI